MYSTVAEAYNKRVDPLARLWTRGTIRVWFVDDQGNPQQAQADANLQYIRPDKVNLTLNHVGKVDPIAVIGSNPERYWCIDLGGKQRVAKVGQHALATPERVRQLGLPVYALDLIELVGITPLPTSWPDVGTGEAPDLRWSDDGRTLVLTMPGRTGRRRLFLDPDTYVPGRVELLGRGGVVLASSELSQYQAPIGALASSVPTEIVASIDEGRTRVRLRMNEPDVRHTIKPIAFDFDALVRAYDVNNVVSLDEETRAQR